MEQFIGMHIVIKVVRLPSYRKQRKKSTLDEPELNAGVMGRKRFDHLKTYLHLNNNNNMKEKDEPGYDPLFQVYPVFEKMRQTLLKIEPQEKNSVDEQMIPYKERISMKQYMKNKPCKWRIKVFFLADICGLVFDFQIYTGKDTVTSNCGLGVGGEVVLHLVRDIPRGLN